MEYSLYAISIPFRADPLSQSASIFYLFTYFLSPRYKRDEFVTRDIFTRQIEYSRPRGSREESARECKAISKKTKFFQKQIKIIEAYPIYLFDNTILTKKERKKNFFFFTRIDTKLRIQSFTNYGRENLIQDLFIWISKGG